jgi:hypothetical protein
MPVCTISGEATVTAGDFDAIVGIAVGKLAHGPA